MANLQIRPNPFSEKAPWRSLSLVVEDQKFWVPREGLAANSPVFQAMLYGDFQEAQKDEITLPGKTAKEVQEFLTCLIYPHFKDIDLTNVEAIFSLSAEYQVEHLRQRAENFLASNIQSLQSGDNQLLDILRISSKLLMKAILKNCVQRCTTEFSVGNLQPILKDLPVEVGACFMVGGKVCQFIAMPASANCSSARVGCTPAYIKCIFCGKYRCSGCQSDFDGFGQCISGMLAKEETVDALLNQVCNRP